MCLLILQFMLLRKLRLWTVCSRSAHSPNSPDDLRILTTSLYCHGSSNTDLFKENSERLRPTQMWVCERSEKLIIYQMIFKETKAEIIIQLIGRSINRKKKKSATTFVNWLIIAVLYWVTSRHFALWWTNDNNTGLVHTCRIFCKTIIFCHVLASQFTKMEI